MKTKILIFLLIIGITLTGCKSAKQLAMEGKYDKALDKALGALKKQPDNVENLEILKLSFENANDKNLSRIYQLQAKNSADRWMEMADLYQSLQNRQNKMKQILPFLSGSTQSSIKIYDYNNQLITAQNKAADYNYDKGMALLNMNSKSKAREAVNSFKQAKKYDPSDPEISRMIDEAIFRGTNHVLYIVNNYTSYNLSYDFMTRMSQIANSYYLNSSWIKYYTFPENGFNYDYVIELNFESINLVPERSDTRTSTYTKTIDDGWEYERDRSGNVKKDANGKDAMRKKTQQVRCEVMVTTQTKSAFVNARMNYIYTKSNRIIKSIPISSEQAFVYQYATFRGDKRAIDSQILSKLPKAERPALFPSTTDLIYMSQEKIEKMVSSALSDNDRLIRNSD